MIFSFLKIGFNINQSNITIYEDDTNIELEEIEDKLFTLREEAIRLAPLIKDIYALYKKG